MKYEVIGVTFYENDNIPNVSYVTDKLIMAIVNKIRKDNLKISGYDHQECGWTPVLNTGQKAIFSQRAWGEIMAIALCIEQLTGHEYSIYGCANRAIEKSNDNIIYSLDSLPNLDGIRDYYNINISEKTYEDYKRENKVFNMFIPLDISLADPLDIITFTYKNKVIEFTIIDKCVKANSEEIECEFNEKISDYDSIDDRFIMIIEPDKIYSFNSLKKAFLLEVLREYEKKL